MEIAYTCISLPEHRFLSQQTAKTHDETPPCSVSGPSLFAKVRSSTTHLRVNTLKRVNQNLVLYNVNVLKFRVLFSLCSLINVGYQNVGLN